jgi:glycosyltransferase involved in cell wall biosynthesis
LHTDPFSPYFSGFINWLRKRIAKKVIKNADTLRVVTKGVADEIVSKLGYERNKINVLPIYINRERIEKAQALFDLHVKYDKSFLMLMVARLAPEKNIRLALKILALVVSRFPGAGLVVVGSGPEEKSLKSYAKKLGVDKCVAFEGWQEDLSSYYRTSNIFLQTSNFEGYGLALVEAALSGLPVMTTPVGVALEFENGKDLYICPPNNPEYWAQVVLDLIENNQKREILKINMKNSIEKKLVSKEAFFLSLRDNWERAALKLDEK